MRLSRVPRAFRDALKAGRRELDAALRGALGWRLVLSEDGADLPLAAAAAPAANRFAPLAEGAAAAAEQPPGAEQRPPLESSEEGDASGSQRQQRPPPAAQQLSVATLEGLPQGCAVVAVRDGRRCRWGVARPAPLRGGGAYDVHYLPRQQGGVCCPPEDMVQGDVCRAQVHTWDSVPKSHRRRLRALAAAWRLPGPVATSEPMPPLEVLDGSLVCKRFGTQPAYGVLSRRQHDSVPPYLWDVSYADGTGETFNADEVQRWRVAPDALVPVARLPALHGLGACVPPPASLDPGLADGAVVTKRFVDAATGRARPFFGVARLDPEEEAPYVYVVEYTDGDQESMTEAEVGRCRPKGARAAIPAAALPVLARLCASAVALAAARAPPPPAPAAGAPGAAGGAAAGTAAGGAAAAGAAGAAGGSGAAGSAGGAATPERRRQRAAARTRRRREANVARAATLGWQQGGLTVACINACGLTRQKACELHATARELGIDVLGVCETWEGRCAPDAVAGYHWVGKPRPGGSGGGVGFYIARTLTPLVTVHTDTCTPEAIWLELRGCRAGAPPLCIGLVYLPPDSLGNAVRVEATLNLLHMDIRRFQEKGEVVVMGDLNARVGRAQAAGGHIGEHGEPGPADAAGARLVRLLSATDLYLLNGRRAPRHGTTPEYTRCRGNQSAVLDYVLAPKAWAVATPPAVAPRSALTVRPVALVSNTDHALLAFRAPFPVAPRRAPVLRVPRPQVHLLTLPNVPGSATNPHKEAYQAAVEEACVGFAAEVDRLRAQAEAGAMETRQACEQAKQNLTDRIFAAVDGSIGFKHPRRLPGASRPPIWTSTVRRAVAARNAAAAAAAAAAPDAAAAAAAAAALKTQQAALRATVKEARAAHLASQVEVVFASKAANDGKGMWRGLAAIGGGRAAAVGPAALQNPRGDGLLTDDAAVADTLAAHYARVSTTAAHASNAEPFDEQHRQHVERTVRHYREAASYADEGCAELSEAVAVEEVTRACLSLHNGKAPSPLDAVHNELLKHGGAAMYQALARLFDMQFALEAKAKTPGVIRPIYKKGDRTVAANYRPITLGSAVDKLYNLVLNQRITKHLEAGGGLHDAQHGFREARSAVDNVFMLRACLDARLRAKLDTYLLFLDIEKAYDKVWRAGLLWHLWRKGVRGRLFRVLANMLDSTPCMVLHNGALSEPVEPDMGWEQGDTLATTMFNVFVNGVLEHVWEQCPGIALPAGQPPGGWEKLVALMYADDFVGLAASVPELQALADATRYALRRWRLNASVSTSDGSKTAVMRVGKRRPPSRDAMPAVQWGGVALPRVREYRYLGVTITDDGKWDAHLQRRMEAGDGVARRCRKIAGVVRLPMRLRKLVLTTCVQPVVTHAAAVWARPTVALRQRLDSWQMSSVARAFHCPPTATHLCLQQELGLAPLHVVCETLMLRYWHHLQTLPSTRLLASVAQAWPGPWRAAVDGLLREYEVDADAAASMPRGNFRSMCATKAMAYLRRYWERPPRRHDGAVLARYREAFGVGLQTAARTRPRSYTLALTEDRPSLLQAWGAELCMQLRSECLPLRSMHCVTRPRETPAARRRRELCPSCRQQPETPVHFLLECSAFAAARRELFAGLQAEGAVSPVTQRRLLAGAEVAGVPCLLAHFRELPPDGAWRALMGARYLEHPDLGGLVATYMATAWSIRKAALNGREADGGDPGALASVPG